MAKPAKTTYTFTFTALPNQVHEARWLARFLKQALRFYGLKLVNMKKEPNDVPDMQEVSRDRSAPQAR